MPEGDTVFRAADKLRTALAGKTLTRCDVRVPKFATVDLTGQVVDEVLSRGKHLFIRVGDASIHSHLKMDGAWLVDGQIRRVPQHKVRIILETADSRAAGVDLGMLEILRRDLDMDAVAHLGPDLLGDDWEPRVAAANLTADPDRPLAETLLDQRVMAGVGNVYANELCFVRGLLPTRPVGDVADLPALVDLAHRMLVANRGRWTRSTTGDLRPGRRSWVYGRVGQACRRCGTSLHGGELGRVPGEERMVTWCPHCQT